MSRRGRGDTKILVHSLSKWSGKIGHVCPSTFPQNDVCLLWLHFRRCGNGPSTLHRGENLYLWSGLICLVLVAPPRKHKMSQVSTVSLSQPHTDRIHPFYLFVATSRVLWMCWIEAGAAAEDGMPSTTRCFVSYLLGAITVCSLACRLSLCVAIFGSGFKTLCSLSYPLRCIYKCT